MKNILLFLLISLLMLSCSNPTDNTEPIDEADIDTKIGQMLLIGFRGLSVTPNDQIVKDAKEGRIGGIILFDRDVELQTNVRNIESPEQVKNLVASIQQHSEIPLFVAIDQEGGRVNRLKERFGFPKTVSQQYLGQLNNNDSTRFYAEQTAATLSSLGINVNFSPVVDLNINPTSPAIGNIERSFSADPGVVYNHSKIVIEEHHEKNLLNALKHFPGHGSAESDSHLGFTDITNTWQSVELEPYRMLINNGFADFVMTAHIYNQNLDSEYPATLSNKIMTKILREQLNFTGVIISDDMNMSAISQHYGLETAIEKSINAGVDILIFANNLIYDEQIAVKGVDIIKKLVEEGKISKERINDSYNRIMKLKEKLL